MNIVKDIKNLRHTIYLKFCHLLPIDTNKIVLWSDNFKSFGCSPKYIATYLCENFPGKYDIVWVLENSRAIPDNMPDNIRIVRYFSMQYLKEISTAKIIICNSRMGKSHYFIKRKGQKYIQTWHSSLRLKKIENDAPNLPKNYVDSAKSDSKKIDLLLSGCRFSTDIFRRAFWYNGEILESGTPRCDCFFGDTQSTKDKVYKYFGIKPDEKLALYAPTFRDNKKADLFGMDFEKLKNALGENWQIGCRLHPNLNAEISADIAIPMSKYPDMQELLVACDLLITDYSSSMFDALVSGKKCILYVPDLDTYTQNERGLYFGIEDLPFMIAKDMDKLCFCINEPYDYQKSYNLFNKQIGSYENGNAAKAVAEWISAAVND